MTRNVRLSAKIRVFMLFRTLSEAISIEPQVIVMPERIGFTIVEWGSSEIRS